MKIVVADWESFYDRKSGYSLSVMTTENYVRDPRFEAHGCAIKWAPDQRAIWYDQQQIKQVMAQTDWSDVFMIHHHGQFDSAIEAWHYGCHPRALGCTLSMARLLLGNHLSVSLDSVRKHYGLPSKITPYHLFEGRRWNEIAPAVQQQIGEGAVDEVESIWWLFNEMMKEFPREELPIVDMAIRMFTEPTLTADIEMLRAIWAREHIAKEERRNKLGISEADLQSNNRFAALLREQGVEPETKDGKNGAIFAFAKTDPFMESLLDSRDEIVKALAEARIGAKSTALQTRAATIGQMARRGPLAVYKKYCGAHTTRMAGGDSSNFENFKSDSDVPPDEPTIRRALKAPEGCIIFKPDASQIECRLLNFIAGQEDKVAEFRDGKDPYAAVASAFAGHAVTKQSHPQLRQAGKVVELQAGYQSGEAKIKATIRIKARIEVTIEEALRWKQSYRSTHPKVVELWGTAGRMISRIAGGDPIQWGPTLIKDNRIWLPNGCPLIYSTLEFYTPTQIECEALPEFKWRGYWRYRSRKGWTEIYAGKLVENWIQALARVHVFQAAARIMAQGFRIVNTEHDSLWVLLREDARLEHNKAAIIDEMRKEPAWLPGIPLDAEGH